MLTTLLLLGTLAQSPQTGAEPHKDLIHAAIAAHALAQALDLSTTEFAIGAGSGREANPIMRPFAGHPIAMGFVKGGYAVGTSYLLIHLHQTHPKIAVWCAVGSAVVTSVIAARNARVIQAGAGSH